MTKAIPKWMTKQYSTLWKNLENKEFDFNRAKKILKENVSITLSGLKKNGWLTIKLNPKDSRKRIYKLKTPEKAITEIER